MNKIWKSLLKKQENPEATVSQDELSKAYQLVYQDLCKQHRHVMALFNGTLHRDDIRPTHNQVNYMIEYIVHRGNPDI